VETLKNPETCQFLFLLAHILAHMVFTCLLPEVPNHPQLFFSSVGVCRVAPRLKGQFAGSTAHYLFPECFQNLRAGKNKNRFDNFNTV
jgi:hypothetical protein